MVIAALLIGGGATAFVLVNQEKQTGAHEAALTEHAEAVTAYEAAWEEFERQNSGTRDDHGQLSATSLDNTEEVLASFTGSIAAADALQRTEFPQPDDTATDAELTKDTLQIRDATGAVEQVTKQLAATSTLFLDSLRATTLKHLTAEADKAEQELAGIRDAVDAGLATQLERAIADARVLANDPKAHPTDLRHAMEGLVTLTGEVTASAGPTIAEIDGHWVTSDVSIQSGGSKDLLARAGEIGQNEASLAESLDRQERIVYMEAGWVPNGGCLQASAGKVARHSQLWYCPAGVPVPAEAHAEILTFNPNQHPDQQQVEDVSRDRLISSWILYRQ